MLPSCSSYDDRTHRATLFANCVSWLGISLHPAARATGPARIRGSVRRCRVALLCPLQCRTDESCVCFWFFVIFGWCGWFLVFCLVGALFDVHRYDDCSRGAGVSRLLRLRDRAVSGGLFLFSMIWRFRVLCRVRCVRGRDSVILASVVFGSFVWFLCGPTEDRVVLARWACRGAGRSASEA